MLNDYIVELVGGVDYLIREFKELTEGQMITEETFISKVMKHNELKFITTPRGFRTILYHFSKSKK